MTQTFNPFVVAGQLSGGQVSTIRGLGTTPCMLGCSEATAKRLAYANTKRPALVDFSQGKDGPLWALNASGMAVQEQLGGPFA